MNTDPNRFLGATVRATNRTFGLAPSRPLGEPETVTEIVDPYSLVIRTAEGNVYSNGDFTVVRFASESVSEDREAYDTIGDLTPQDVDYIDPRD